MELFFHLDRDTPLHRLHPATKLALLGGHSVLALLLGRPAALLALNLAILAEIALARSLANVRRVRVFLAVASIAAVVLWTLAGRGPTPLVLWMSREGLAAGIVAALRIDALILAGLLLLSTARNEEVVAGLRAAGVPYPLCFAFSTALRLAPTFVGTGLAVRESQRARGLDPDAGSVAARLRAAVPLLVPTFLTTIRMTGHLAMSLESRGFGYSPRRTSLLECRFGARDAAALALLAAAVATGVVLR